MFKDIYIAHDSRLNQRRVFTRAINGAVFAPFRNNIYVHYNNQIRHIAEFSVELDARPIIQLVGVLPHIE